MTLLELGQPAEDVKLCRKCDAMKPITDFHANRSAANGLQAYCKVCNAEMNRRWRNANAERVRERSRRYTAATRDSATERMRAWRAANPEKRRDRHLRQRYNITFDDYTAMAERQGGGCALCGRSDTQLHVDHDHSCCPGQRSCGHCIRGLLCGYCNRMLGMFADDPERVLTAFTYLVDPPAKKVPR